MAGHDRPQSQHRDVQTEHRHEADVVNNREHLLQAHLTQSHGDTTRLHGKDLIANSQNWQAQFESLPHTKDGKIDCASWKHDDPRWQTVEKMYQELNKPGGAIKTAESHVNQITKELTTHQTHLAEDHRHPQRSKA